MHVKDVDCKSQLGTQSSVCGRLKLANLVGQRPVRLGAFVILDEIRQPLFFLSSTFYLLSHPPFQGSRKHTCLTSNKHRYVQANALAIQLAPFGNARHPLHSKSTLRQ